MTKITRLLVAVAVFFGTVEAGAAAGDSWTCALTKGMECFPDEGCSEMSLQEMNLPRFVRIDLSAKTMNSLVKEVPRNTKIASVERLNKMTVMHGTELRGWTMALAEDSGDLTLSAAGKSEAFVVFGSCIAQ